MIGGKFVHKHYWITTGSVSINQHNLINGPWYQAIQWKIAQDIKQSHAPTLTLKQNSIIIDCAETLSLLQKADICRRRQIDLFC